ncbi:MAG: FAD-binding oxidoreductase [Halobacteriaceae archaeon]
MPQSFEATVRSVRPVGPDTVAVTFETPPSFAAAPGQFVRVSVDGESRFYTLSSPSTEGGFELTVSVDPEGEVAPWLADRESGDAVDVEGPFGRNYYEGESAAVVLAGGPGVGPAVGIAERVVRDGGRVAVVYRGDPVHEDRLAGLAAADAPVFVVSDDAGLRAATTLAVADVGGQPFVYGFADFVADAEDALEAAGADVASAKVESFG